jgi:predicted nuclease of predicted toxin-antitoxin system
VAVLRAEGYDVVYASERQVDLGDAALLAEAFADQRVFVTKDHDLGTIVFLDGAPHCGILLVDDFGRPAAEAEMLRRLLLEYAEALNEGAFVRADADGGVRIGGDPR